MERTKEQWEELVGHTIRLDTYLILERIQKNESYFDIIQDLDSNREKYGIKEGISLVRLKTIKDYLSLIGISIQEEETETQKDSDRVPRNTFTKFKGRGVYGIYSDNQLLYIGSTGDFGKRFESHNVGFKSKNDRLYVKMRRDKADGRCVKIMPIINVDDLCTEASITDRDIQAMELALISIYKPMYNYQGRLAPYKFINRKKN